MMINNCDIIQWPKNVIKKLKLILHLCDDFEQLNK